MLRFLFLFLVNYAVILGSENSLCVRHLLEEESHLVFVNQEICLCASSFILDLEMQNEDLNEIKIYTWEFGDGSTPITSFDSTIIHCYETPGVYQVRLTLSRLSEVCHFFHCNDEEREFNQEDERELPGEAAHYFKNIEVVSLDGSEEHSKKAMSDSLREPALNSEEAFFSPYIAHVTAVDMKPEIKQVDLFYVDDFFSEHLIGRMRVNAIKEEDVLSSVLEPGIYSIDAKYIASSSSKFESESLVREGESITLKGNLVFKNEEIEEGAALFKMRGSVTTSLSPTTTTVTSNLNPSLSGKEITITAAVASTTPGSPTGTIIFSLGETTLGTVKVTGKTASISISKIPVGTNQVITATYSGDKKFSGSSGTITQIVNEVTPTTTISQTSPTMIFSSNHSCWEYEQPILLKVKLSGSKGEAPTGTVTFSTENTILGTKTISGGIATLVTEALPVGCGQVITATYSGDQNFTSCSGQLVQTIIQAGTTMGLTADINSSQYNQPVTFSALLATAFGGTPTGTVILTLNDSTLGEGNVSKNLAIITTQALPVGSNQIITALYEGDTNYLSSGCDFIHTVTPATTTAALSSSASTSTYNEAIILTATLTTAFGGAPSGTVTFMLGDVEIGKGAVSEGVATLSTISIPAGKAQTIAAHYNGDGNFLSSSAIILQTVKQSATTMTLTSSQTPSAYDEPVTLTASLVGSYGGSPTGLVTFSLGNIPLGTAALSEGVAAFTTTAIPVGAAQKIVATYSGDDNYLGSKGTVLQTVNQAETTTTLISNLNPVECNQEVMLIVAITTAGEKIPSGVVTFTIGNTLLGTANLSDAIATLCTSSIPVGSLQTITATYSGDANYLNSSGTTSLTVDRETTSTLLSSDCSLSQCHQSVNLVATVSAPSGKSPAGTVTFSHGSLVLGTAALENGSANLSTKAIPVGSAQVITATYNGDANSLISSATVVQTVNPVATTTAVTSNHPSTEFDQSTTLTAVVTTPYGEVVTGTVTFSLGDRLLGIEPLSDGIAVLTTSAIPVGNEQAIIATYQGGGNYLSSSGSILQTVTQAATSIALTSSLNVSEYNQMITFNATVSTSFGGSPSGLVTFAAGDTILGTSTLSAGVATLSTSILPVGKKQVITATYAGDMNFSNSSGTYLQTVVKATTTSSLTSALNPAQQNQTVTLTATVTPPYGGKPTGVVTFMLGKTVLGTATVIEGVATLSTKAISVGRAQAITAIYSGDDNFQGSSAALFQTVNKGEGTITLSSSANNSFYGEPITLQAVVSPVEGVYPTGVITFSVDDKILSTTNVVSGGVASIQTSALGVGNNQTVQASFQDDSDYSIKPGTLLQTVVPANTSFTLDAMGNQEQYGQSIILNATVLIEGLGNGSLTGNTVVFYDNSTRIGCASLDCNGKASFQINQPLSVGEHVLSGAFNDESVPQNPNFNSSKGIYDLTVAKADSALTTGADTSGVAYRQNVSLTAQIEAEDSGLPKEKETYIHDLVHAESAFIFNGGLAPLVNKTLPINNHQKIVVEHESGVDVVSSSGRLGVIKAQSSIIIDSYAQLFSDEDPVVISTIVSSDSAAHYLSGNVRLFVDGVEKQMQYLIEGRAMFHIADLSIGHHLIIAYYSGDEIHLPSTSTPFSLSVQGVMPPIDLKIEQKSGKLNFKADRVNVITWKQPQAGQKPVVYYIYRDEKLRKKIGTVYAHCYDSKHGNRYKFEDLHRKKGCMYSYYIVSVDKYHRFSEPVKIIQDSK